MTNTNPQSLPAFPTPEIALRSAITDMSPATTEPERYIVGIIPGMTLRDYFIAHAPAEPQPWFVPVMPPKPELPDPDEELSQEDAAEWRRLDEYAPEEGNDRLKAFCERQSAAYEFRRKWDDERKKQRYLQWPAAWADAVLKARAA